jgi:rod shape determining protein RodA
VNYFSKNLRYYYGDSLLLAKLKKFPYALLFLLCILACTGFAMMYSAASGNIHPWALRQVSVFLISLPLMILIAVMDLRFFYKISYISYAIGILLLLAVLISGYKAMGATRWIKLGFFNLQPSEFMKIMLVLTLARYFHNINYQQINRIRYLIIPSALSLLPFLLIVKQPDLGTALTTLMLAGVIFFVVGVSMWIFATIGGLCIALLPLLWHFLHDYQKQRIMTFFEPNNDVLGSGYNIHQSMIAIGSGGMFGKGFLSGSQVQLDFLPEKQTDFVFTMFAEEGGFISCFLLIAIYLLITIFGLHVAINTKSQFGRIVAFGITALFFMHFFINVAMVSGIIPVVGSPLPLMSYGGTIMLASMISFGLLANVYIHNRCSINVGASSFL